MNIKYLTDTQLVHDTKLLVAQEAKCTIAVLIYLNEIEERKLFSEYKYPSMMDFIVRELGYAGGSAARRLQSARLMREIPELKEKLVSRSHSINNLYKAAIFFRKEKITDPTIKRSIITKLENKTQLECERIFLELTKIPLPSESIRPVSQNHMQLKINVTDETHKKLDDVKCLMGFHMIDDEFFSVIADEAKENIVTKRFKLTKKGRKTHSMTRVPSNYDQRKVYEDAEEKVCENCGGLFYLQKDHLKSFALGGSSDSSNLRLLCFHCNQRARINAKL